MIYTSPSSFKFILIAGVLFAGYVEGEGEPGLSPGSATAGNAEVLQLLEEKLGLGSLCGAGSQGPRSLINYLSSNSNSSRRGSGISLPGQAGPRSSKERFGRENAFPSVTA